MPPSWNPPILRMEAAMAGHATEKEKTPWPQGGDREAILWDAEPEGERRRDRRRPVHTRVTPWTAHRVTFPASGEAAAKGVTTGPPPGRGRDDLSRERRDRRGRRGPRRGAGGTGGGLPGRPGARWLGVRWPPGPERQGRRAGVGGRGRVSRSSRVAAEPSYKEPCGLDLS